MTTPSTVRKAGPFIGDGSQTTWPFEFKVFVEADIAVVIADAEGNETELVLNSDYSVELNDNQETSPGGTVTYPLPPGPGDDPVPNLATGGRLSIVGNVPFDQLLDIPTGGNFNPIALENQLDRTTMQVQQLAEEFSRSVRVPVTYDADDLTNFTGDVIRLADSADNIDVLAANVSDINTVADDLNLEVSNITTVAQHIDDVVETSGGLPEISLIAADLAGTGYDYDLGSITVPSTGTGTSPASAIITVATNIEDVQAVAANEANINAVVANEANIDIVAGIDDDVTTVATNIADVQTVAANIDDVNTVAANIASVNTVAGIDADVSIVAGIASDVPEVAANEANINVVAGISADVTTVAGIESGVTTVVDNLAAILDAPTQAANASASATAASGSASAAAASASAAAAVIASGMYSAVQDKSADYPVVEADAGDLIRVTTTGGSRTITLPAISGVGEGFKVSVAKWTNDANTVMVVRSGSDTINGQVDYLLLNQYGSATFVADAETSQWFAAGSGVSTGSVVVDRFSGNGSTTEFTLSGDPASENNTQVFVGGVYRQKDTYSLSGTALTFGSAPPSGTDNVEVVWTQPVAIGVPSDSTVTAAKLVDGAVTTEKLASGAVVASKIASGAVVSHLGFTPADQATTYTESEVDAAITAAVASAVASAVAAATPPGTVIHVAMSSAPSGYLAANGAAVSRTTYAALFAAIGTTFGAGDGSTTFLLPDLRNRMAIGSGGLYSLGATGGSKDAIVVAHTHSITDPGHNHELFGDADTAPDGGVGLATDDGIATAIRADAISPSTTGISVNSTGSSGTDANLPPYLALLACIKF